MTTQPVLIDGAWRPSNASGTFTATDPSTRRLLDEHYPVSTKKDVELAIEAGVRAAVELARVEPEARAQFLEQLATNLEANAEALVTMAAKETGLPASPRLRDVELPRTTNQLRQAAAAARDRSWCVAEIDTQANLRSTYQPLGAPVVVFGPNNFPYAFNAIAGGDFAAAIAAGNPVIAKAHHSHPGTTRLLAEATSAALEQSALPKASVQLLYHMPKEVGLELVSDRRVGAVAFTGSRSAGLALKAAADAAGVPVYVELSSVNPIFVLPGALRQRGAAIASELAGSCALGAGQFCTNPGLSVVVAGDEAEAYVDTLRGALSEKPAGTLLGVGAPAGIAAALGELRGHGAELLLGGHEIEGGAYRFQNTLLRVSGELFLRNPTALQTEAFGTVHLVVVTKDVSQMCAVAEALEGNLTGCIYSHEGDEDEADYARVEPALRARVGRLLNDKMPTGVAVSAAMHHGGPYPSTGHPGFTSVGIPAAMLRFAARRCYDAVRPGRLPAELRDENPTGNMWRRVDGSWTTAAVGS